MPRIGGDLDVVQLSSDPTTPVAGRTKLYFKSDGLLYKKLPNGTVSLVEGGSSGVTLDTSQVITGTKVFSNQILEVRRESVDLPAGNSVQAPSIFRLRPWRRDSAGSASSTNADITAEYVNPGVDGTTRFTFGGSASHLRALIYHAQGLNAGVQQSRFVGGTNSGAPTSGTFSNGDWIVTQNGRVWTCSVGGTPGTWVPTGDVTLDTAQTLTAAKTFAPLLVADATNTLRLPPSLIWTPYHWNGTNSAAVNVSLRGDIDANGGNPRVSTASMLQGSTVKASGLTGSNFNSRWVGTTNGGAPTSGTFVTGDWVISTTAQIFICTVGGTPGTWVQVGGATLDTAQTFTGAKNFSVPLPANGTSTSAVVQIVGLQADGAGALTSKVTSLTANATTGDLELGVGATSVVKANSWAGAYYAATGNTGAATATRWVGGTPSGAPSGGTWRVGDWVIAVDGRLWICTVAGTPGTWVDAGAGGGGGANTVTTDTAQTITGIKTFDSPTYVRETLDVYSSSAASAKQVFRHTATSISGAPLKSFELSLNQAGRFTLYDQQRAVAPFGVNADAKQDALVLDSAGIYHIGRILTEATGTATSVATSLDSFEHIFRTRRWTGTASADETVSVQAKRSSANTGAVELHVSTGLVAAGFFGSFMRSTGFNGLGAVRYLGATNTAGPPTTGTYEKGDITVSNGNINICTAGGTPGTWTSAITTTGDQNGLTGNKVSVGILGAAAFRANSWAGLPAGSVARFLGATDTANEPTSGTYDKNDFVISNGNIFICTTGGTPGTWVAPYSDANPPQTMNMTDFPEASVPTPPSGQATLFTDTGSTLKMKDDAGIVRTIGPSSADLYTRLQVSADQSIQNATAGGFVNVTGLSFTGLAGVTYEIEGTLWLSVAATTTGWRAGVTGPVVANSGIVFEYMTSTTAEANFAQTNIVSGALTPSMPIGTASAWQVGPMPVRFRGYFTVSGTTGTVQMQVGSELNTAAVTVRKGSQLLYRAI